MLWYAKKTGNAENINNFQTQEEQLKRKDTTKRLPHLLCVLSCHIRVSSESTLCNHLNAKELLAQNRRDI